MRLAVIGGTGMRKLLFSSADRCQKEAAQTPIGGLCHYHRLDIGKHEVYFVDRHHSLGEFHLPHQLLLSQAQQHYMSFLAVKLGLKVFLATSAVGAIRGSYNIGECSRGDIYYPSDAIDYTGWPFTFADFLDRHATKFHRSMDQLFCPDLAQLISGLTQGNVQNIGILGSTLCGPRFETRAEIEKYRRDGVDFLSMSTCFPEAVLARELGVSYGLLACVSNLCPEIAGNKLDGQHVQLVMAQQQDRLVDIIMKTMDELDRQNNWPDYTCQQQPSVFD